jgi:hydroxypyruvate reductase
VIAPTPAAGHADADGAVEWIMAGHPVPDPGSLDAGARALALATGLGPGDHLLALVSGGGSALMCAPAPGVSLAEKQALTRSLLHCGAAISEINCVRKHLSRVKGGRLALAAFPATVQTLAISDIPGDDPQLIASGPTLPDPTTLADARAVLDRHRLAPPPSVLRALSEPGNESLKPDHPLASDLQVEIVARAADALAAAGLLGDRTGHHVTMLGDRLEGEARRLGAEHAGLARAHPPGDRPRLWLSGGETTVTVTHRDGRGGPNLEYLLGLAIALDGAEGIYALACDTDGQDGTEPVAGAVVTPSTLTRARQLGLDARTLLERNDSHAFFSALEDLIVTGPTHTNVNDFRAILIEASAARGS